MLKMLLEIKEVFERIFEIKIAEMQNDNHKLYAVKTNGYLQTQLQNTIIRTKENLQVQKEKEEDVSVNTLKVRFIFTLIQ